jgi:ferredoxin
MDETPNSPMKVKLNKSICDGFGTCGGHAPDLFEIDEWGYASLKGDGTVPAGQEGQARRAIIACPVHAIVEEK